MILRGDNLLKALRKERGLTQMQMAAQTGLAQGYLNDLESGRRTGAKETIELIAAALEVAPRLALKSFCKAAASGCRKLDRFS